MTKFVTLSIERLNQVIEALNNYCNTGEIDCADDLVAELLAERDQNTGEQEPVAWIWTEWSSRNLTFDGPPAVPSVRDELTKPVWTPLYTHPQPKREPLTDEKIEDIWRDNYYGYSHDKKMDEGGFFDAVRDVELAHNIK